jgi:hypothetical protein
MKNYRVLFFLVLILTFAFSVPHAQAIGDYPGPSNHYHVKTVWTDTRVFTWMNGSSKNAIGFVFKENSAAFYFPYNYASPQEVAQANAVYSTLLTAFSTGEEVSIHIFASYGGHWYIDQAQVGLAY